MVKIFGVVKLPLCEVAGENGVNGAVIEDLLKMLMCDVYPLYEMLLRRLLADSQIRLKNLGR